MMQSKGILPLLPTLDLDLLSTNVNIQNYNNIVY